MEEGYPTSGREGAQANQEMTEYPTETVEYPTEAVDYPTETMEAPYMPSSIPEPVQPRGSILHAEVAQPEPIVDPTSFKEEQ